ncbi:MAG: ABC transporter permease [Crocinitomicaceae bacterium]|nr:ABC transporter permease [Crocinitomicaceae bacterium]
MKGLHFLQKSLRGLAVLWGSFTLVFIIFTAIPDPARQLAGQHADAELIADMRIKFGLDRPWHERYFNALTQLSPVGPREGGWGLRMPSLGESFVRQESVSVLLSNAFPGTAILALTSLILALSLGIPMGLLATRNPGGLFDRIVVGGSVLGMSAPSFFAAVLIGYLFAVQWGSWTGLPLTGSLWDLNDQGQRVMRWRHLVLPALTLGIRPLAVLAQLTRGAASDVLAMPHVKTARAFGASDGEVLRRHVLRNAMNPVLTSASGWLAQLLAGAVFVEFVFGWKGLGFLLFDALEQQDLPVVMGGVLVVSFVFVCVNAMTDAAYRWVDPRAAQA